MKGMMPDNPNSLGAVGTAWKLRHHFWKPLSGRGPASAADWAVAPAAAPALLAALGGAVMGALVLGGLVALLLLLLLLLLFRGPVVANHLLHND
jgi:predicted lipid-binding transport protein (Tim44 family)